ncbi:MAG: 30S ribosomal protein S6 [Candidatus Peribacteraceae bacterium]|nr:30S ribosomal protein S6 [Candidatus Peribacteraceae bacterium]
MPKLQPSSEDVRVYEVAVLYPFPINQKEEKNILDEIDTIFKEADAKLIESDKWGNRGLAYNIEGYNEGNFIIYYYEIDPLKIKEIDEALRILPGALRHLIVKPPKGYEVVKFSKDYQEWISNRETESERRTREKEEKIKKQVADKAKRQVKRTENEKKAPVKKSEATPLEEKKLSEQLDKIISDDELDL